MKQSVVGFDIEGLPCENRCCFYGVLSGVYNERKIRIITKDRFTCEDAAVEYLVGEMQDQNSPLLRQLIRKVERIGKLKIGHTQFIENTPNLSVIQGGKQ